MGRLRFQNYGRKSWWKSDSWREEEHHALREFSSSLQTSLLLSTLGLLARFAETRGQPLDPTEEHCPSDSLVFLGRSLATKEVERVRYLMSLHPISHESMSQEAQQE